MKTAIALGLLALAAPMYAGASSHSFGPVEHLMAARNFAHAVAIGDANGDGRMDLAVSRDPTWTEHELALFLQRSDGTLAPPITIALPSDTFGQALPVTFADLDADGNSEMLVGSSHLLVVDHEAGALSATVAPQARYACDYLASGDIDADDHVDILCHSGLGIPTAATIFYGNGHGGFRATSEMQTDVGSYGVESDFMSVQLADVTGDGRPDLLVSASRVDRFYVYANDGAGKFFSTGTPYWHPAAPSGAWPAALAVLDIDGDGNNEVVTANPDNQPDGRINIYRRAESGQLVLSERLPVRDSTTALLAADFDGDGDQEVLAAHYDFHAVSVVDVGEAPAIAGQPRFELPGFGYGLATFPAAGTAKTLALGDLDGDGCIDLAGATFPGVAVLYGCQPAKSRIPVSDLDGDGFSDLLWRNPVSAEMNTWQWGDLQAWYGCRLPCPWWRVPPWELGPSGDFDGNGATDTFWRNQEDGRNLYLSSGLYEHPVTAVGNLDWEVVATGDFDGDDRSDLVWRNRRTGANVIWGGADRGKRRELRTVADRDWRVAGTGDFDGDGRSDIFWRHRTRGTNVVWSEGRGDRRVPLRPVGVDWDIKGIGDFDGDGHDDVVWRNRKDGRNTVWFSAEKRQRLTLPRVANLDWNIGAVGDYNGDGRSDLAWRNARTGANTIWRSAVRSDKQAVADMDPVVDMIP